MGRGHIFDAYEFLRARVAPVHSQRLEDAFLYELVIARSYDSRDNPVRPPGSESTGWATAACPSTISPIALWTNFLFLPGQGRKREENQRKSVKKV
jgi:hypothetical protein